MKNEQTEKLSERDEIEALLPWYVSGRLDAHSRARVEQYLKLHPETSAHLALVREESDATIAANEAISPPGAKALERLRASVAATPRRQPLSAVLKQLSTRFSDWLAGLAPPQLALAVAMAALLIALQAAAIGALIMERASQSSYQTAGGELTTGESIELIVGFSETATIGGITALLKRLDAVVADGPKSGLYRLRLPASAQEDKGLQAAIEALQQSGVVTVVLPGR